MTVIRRLTRLTVVACAGWLTAFATEQAAFAHGTEVQLRGHDLQITVDSRWAGNANGGYYPIRIRVVNRGPSRNLAFRISSNFEAVPVVSRAIGAQQNATVQFTLSVPMVGEGTYATLGIYHRGRKLEKMDTQINLPDAGSGEIDRPALLVISQTSVDCDRFEEAVTSTIATPVSGGFVRPVSGRTSDHQTVPPAMLPDSWIDYSGLDLVAVSLDTLSKLPVQNRSALLNWVHCGGNLIVYSVGEAASQSKPLRRLLALDSHSSASPRWEPADPKKRKMISIVQAGQPSVVGLTRPPQVGPNMFAWKGDAETFVRSRLMLGYVFAFQDNPFPGTPHDWAWFFETMKGKDVGAHRLRWTTRNGISARQDSEEFLQFLIPGIKGVPVFSFLVLITVFTIVIGPLNYMFLLRRKQLYLLVLTIPVVALVTSLSLFGYSIVAHGFGIKSRIRSFTVLDQASKTAVTTSRVALYAGLAPSNGLRFDPQTAVYTIWPKDQSFEMGNVDWTETQAFQAGWLRSRTRTQFVTTTHRAERGRLEVQSPSSGKLPVSNGLEWGIESLVVADEGGTLYVGSNIPAGASTKLTKADPQVLAGVATQLDRYPLKMPDGVAHTDSFSFFSARRHWRYHRHGPRMPIHFAGSLAERRLLQLKKLSSDTSGLPAKTYLAVLKQNPNVDLGVDDTNEKAGSHILVGYY